MSDDQSSTESTDKNQLANVITSEGVEWSAYKPPHKPQDLLVNNNGNKVKSSKIKSAER